MNNSIQSNMNNVINHKKTNNLPPHNSSNKISLSKANKNHYF